MGNATYPKTVKAVVKAAAERGDWNKKFKEASLTDDEVHLLDSLMWPIHYGKRIATFDKVGKRLRVAMYRPPEVNEAAQPETKATASIPKDQALPEESDTLDEPEQTEVWSDETAQPDAQMNGPADQMIEDDDQAPPIEYLKKGTDFLIWIGYSAYPTIKAFTDEVQNHGVLRGFRKEPKGYVEGKSRFIFAHDEGLGKGGVIFGYCNPFFKPGAISDKEPPKRRDGQIMDNPNRTYATGTFIPTEGLIDINGLKRRKGHPYIDGDILQSTNFTTHPRERHTEPDKAKASTRWTDEEREELKVLIQNSEKPYTAFREFSSKSNRSMRSIEYQWYHTINKGA